MSVWIAFLHVLNFLAPAAGLGLCLALSELLYLRKKPSAKGALGAWLLYFLAATGVLMLGLAFLGRDGKLATYGALVVVSGTLAAWRTRTRTAH
jgi:hypothetical protein